MASSTELGVYFQPACLQHKYIRHADSSHIFERPERLRAVMVGVAAAVARCEAADTAAASFATRVRQQDVVSRGALGHETPPVASAQDDLSSLLDSLSLQTPAKGRLPFEPTTVLNVVPPPSLPPVSGNILLHSAAVNLSHSTPPAAPFEPLASSSSSSADIPQSSYLRNLVKWAAEAPDRIKATGCEIPEGLDLNPGDLYLGPGSIVAMEGAIQTVCQAVTDVCRSSLAGSRTADVSGTEQPTAGPSSPPLHKRAFCAIRPPGHHCGEDEPSGFCYINNVVVGAMHAYLTEGIDRAVILDFDLHHGNGTQALVMPLNAASHADDLQLAAGKPPSRDLRGRIRRSWKGFYGSVHDIWSYPCEDGDLDLIRDASVSLASHGQYIENVHLQPYETEQDFYEQNYPKYLALLDRAAAFLKDTKAKPEKTVVFVSAGFDACEHEHQGMQRHDRRVPASFFARYTRDITAFADKHSDGKLVSVLEGGYSDRALISGAMGHICGLLDREGSDVWWSEKELVKLERGTKRRRNGKLAPLVGDLASDECLQRTHSLVSNWEDGGSPSATNSAVASPALPSSGRMTLRERQKAPAEHYSNSYELDSPIKRRPKGRPSRERVQAAKLKEETQEVNSSSRISESQRIPLDASLSEPLQRLSVQDTEVQGPARTTTIPEVDPRADESHLNATPTSYPSVSNTPPITGATVPLAPLAGPSRIILKFSRPPGTPST